MLEAITSLIVTTSLLLGSPGPAPLALAATGAVFGVRRGLPFLSGILSGLIVVIILSATGIAALLEAFPSSRLILKVCGALYILYVAFKIASAPIVESKNVEASAAPRFRDGFIFNLLNVKAYIAFLALFAQFQLPMSSPLMATFVTGLLAFAIAVFVDVIWLALGSLLQPVFEAKRLGRIMRIVFAILMLAAVALMFRTA